MRALLTLLLVSLLVSFVVAQYGTCSSTHSHTSHDETGTIGCSSYGNMVTETWLISLTNTNERILLNFTAFDTEANYDFLEIFDGSSSSSNSLGRFSGAIIPGPFRSSANSLFIKFTSDQYVVGNGFRATWQSFVLSSDISPCTSNFQRTLTGSSGSFGCDGYANHLNDTWIINADAGERIVLNFVVFGTESIYDVVRVYDGGIIKAEKLVGEYSGSNLPPPVTASGNQLVINFQTDYSLTSLGFTAEWSSVVSALDPCFNSTSRVYIEYEGYLGCPYGYGNNVNSSWLIHPVGNLIIQLDFLSLNTQENHDYVKIYDGTSTSAHLIGSYSGVTTPSRIVSSGNGLFISFQTDASTTQGGFTATYRTVDQLSPGGCARSGIYNLTQASDTIGCELYGNQVTITWSIQSQSDLERVSIHFNSFDTELNHDYLSIYDGYTSTPVATYSGNTLPEPFISSGTHLVVVFTSDNNGITGQGFNAQYDSVLVGDHNPDDCSTSFSRTLADLSGEFGCSGYGNDVQISWLISVAEGFTIMLHFEAFYTEINSDILTVFDGPTVESNSLGSFSGIQNPPVLTSNSNQMLVRFTSDHSINRLGFAISYTTIYTGADTNSCASSGSHTLSGQDSGSFGCSGYGDNVEVTWLITTASSTRIAIEFTAFQTEYNYDFVYIYDGSSSSAPLLASYSGFTVPPAIQSTSNNIFVVLRSDSSLNYDGFTASYFTILQHQIAPCAASTQQSLTAPSGQFGCDGYSNSIDSSWTITIPPGQRIVLTFTDFDTELYYDYVKVYNGPNSNAPVLGSYSGNVIPTALNSAANSLFVTFHSDSSISSGYRGFTAEYATYGNFGDDDDSCQSSARHTLTQSSGEFGCSGYGNSVDITWTINSYGPIHLYFPHFDTEVNYDYVAIYDGTSSSDRLISRFSGSRTSPVTSSGNNLFIEFVSDSSVSRSGFTAQYSTLIIDN